MPKKDNDQTIIYEINIPNFILYLQNNVLMQIHWSNTTLLKMFTKTIKDICGFYAHHSRVRKHVKLSGAVF